MNSTQSFITTVPQSTEEEACLYALQLCSLSALPMTLTAAIDLNLFEIIVKAGPNAYLSPQEIASQLPTENPQAPVMMDRIMRMLASYNVLTFKTETNDEGKVVRKYGAAPVIQFLTTDEDGVTISAVASLNQGKIFMGSWYCLKDAVLEGGIPFTKAHGMPAYEYQGTDPKFNKLFNEAMRNHSTILTKKILKNYEGLKDVKTLVDVGGGVGGTIKMIMKMHPHLKGINFDLPHVISEAEPISGLEFVSGDMFESVPSGDAILLKFVLHNWSDEHCAKLMRNCYKALPDNGKVILMESIVPVHPEATSIAQSVTHLDLVMMANYQGGKVRTSEDFDAFAKNAGFKGSKVICRYAILNIIEVYKNM